eukprot:PhF_6_TR6820/c0_g1_i2/m.9813
MVAATILCAGVRTRPQLPKCKNTRRQPTAPNPLPSVNGLQISSTRKVAWTSCAAPHAKDHVKSWPWPVTQTPRIFGGHSFSVCGDSAAMIAMCTGYLLTSWLRCSHATAW